MKRNWFDVDALLAVADQNKAQYAVAKPFPYIVIDDFMDASLLSEVVSSFPTVDDLNYYKYENPLEKKLAFDDVSCLPDPIFGLLTAMNSAKFLLFLERLTGVEGLIADPYYRGGGIHQIEKGGNLDVHIDFNKHTKLKLDRRLNVLLYLNQNWEEHYGGCFELWKGHQVGGRHFLEKCEAEILPLFNRLVVFSTSEKSYHGHPKPLTCPDGWTRKSLALYFYTNGRPKEEDVPAHSTTFIKRPEDPEDEALDRLREARNRGRLSTNVIL